MEIIVATYRLAEPGGAETYAITVADHLARLGHSVTLYARALGTMAQQARGRALRVASTPEQLPLRADGVITGVDRGLALELAGRFPNASRLFVVHGSEDFQLPPPAPGAVGATIVLNDLHAARAAACTGSGEVVRMRQPVDLRRFSSRCPPRPRPSRVLLLGNAHYGLSGRGEALRQAWSRDGLEWAVAGGATPSDDVPTAIALADVVVGCGRSVLEAMASGRPAFVHDHSGSEGWITAESYARMEAGGFAVTAQRLPPDAIQLERDLNDYRAEWGQAGRDLARLHHDARDHAAALIALLVRLRPGSVVAEPTTMRALEQLAESQLRSEMIAEQYRRESRQWADLYRHAETILARERGTSIAAARALEAEQAAQAELHRQTEAALDQERARTAAAAHEFETERAALADALVRETQRLHSLQATRRYRLAQRLAWPSDRLRRRSGR